MSVSPIRIGLIGGGSIVRQRHMPGLAKIPGVEVVAVCNRGYNSTREFAAEFSIPRAIDRWEEVVAIEEVDVIWIGTTPYMHCPITLAALEAGKHVFCQSRMSMNLDEARQMAAAAERHPDRVVRFCPPPFGMGGDRTMKRLLQQEQAIGQLRQIQLTSANGLLLDPDLPLTWRLQHEQSGQNVLTLGIYLEVLERWLPPIQRVSAINRIWTQSRIHPSTHNPAPVEIPEAVNVLAELADGSVAVLIVNGVSSHAPSDHLAIWGTEGTVVYDFNTDPAAERIEVGKRGDQMQPLVIPSDEQGQWTVEADFIDAVRTGRTPGILPDPQAGLRYMAIIDAIYRSASLGRVAEVRV